MSTRSLAVGLLFLACALGPIGGCARHVYLTPAEFLRLQGQDPELDELRVHVNRKVLVTYAKRAQADAISVTKDRVMISNDTKITDVPITRQVTGRILSIGSLSSMPLIWVNFDADKCHDLSCAYGFVLTEQDRYSLVILPKRELHEDPIAYRRYRPRRNKVEHRNRLHLQKQRSLAEINDVLAVSRRGGRRVLSIDLQFPKKTRKRISHDTDRPSGG